jgi:glycosyltransferase involved in cell wall biosynthesis
MKRDDETPTIDGVTGPLSVAMISPGWPSGAFANGIIPYVANIAQEMRGFGNTVTVVAQHARGGVDGVDVRESNPFERPRSVVDRAVDSICYRVVNGLGQRRAVVRALVEECRALIEERGLQLVEIEESHGWSRWLQEALPIPVVVRLHGPWFVNGPLRGAVEGAEFRRQVRDEGRALGEARAITAPSLEILERTRAYYGLPLAGAQVIPAPTEMIPPGRRWRPEGCDPETVVFVGRFDRHKGGDLVIDAFAEVARRRPEARLRFVGADAGIFVDDEGRPRTILEQIALRFPDEASASRVEWLGGQPSSALPELRRQGALVVVGSRYETFALTVVEAMAMGCPLVAPRVGGVPEIVEDGVNGLLFEPGDAGDMAGKICRLLEDRSLAARLGHRAGLDAERRYEPSTVARRIEANYRRVIESWNHSGRRGPAR